jgi:hypothetical protein
MRRRIGQGLSRSDAKVARGLFDAWVFKNQAAPSKKQAVLATVAGLHPAWGLTHETMFAGPPTRSARERKYYEPDFGLSYPIIDHPSLWNTRRGLTLILQPYADEDELDPLRKICTVWALEMEVFGREWSWHNPGGCLFVEVRGREL